MVGGGGGGGDGDGVAGDDGAVTFLNYESQTGDGR